jgi:hypothetical protein
MKARLLFRKQTEKNTKVHISNISLLNDEIENK